MNSLTRCSKWIPEPYRKLADRLTVEAFSRVVPSKQLVSKDPCVTAVPLTDDREPERVLIEANGTRQIAHVQRRFKDAISLGAH
jgi:hypothetical protein